MSRTAEKKEQKKKRILYNKGNNTAFCDVEVRMSLSLCSVK